VNIAIASAFRNSFNRIPEYVARVATLVAVHPSDHFHLIWVWGDSTDGTVTQLNDHAGLITDRFGGQVSVAVVEHSHGGPVWGSVVSAERFAALSGLFNKMLDSVPEVADTVVWVESDLVWDIRTMGALIAYTLNDHQMSVDMVAPLTFAGPYHYDTWGCRGLDGQQFSPFSPYHSSLTPFFDSLMKPKDYAQQSVIEYLLFEVSSVGSCVAMVGELARRIRIVDGGAIVEFCARAREAGYRIFVDPSLRVMHPY